MNTNSTSDKTTVHNVIILDRSGSMHSIRLEAMTGCNEVISAARKAKEKYSDTMDQVLSIVLFDSVSVDTLEWDSDPMSAKDLTPETYIPGAATPLYDAIGSTVTRLERQIKAQGGDHSVTVTIITDGYENSSREYSLEMIKNMISRLKDEGWSFAYMGADHDVEKVSHSISITSTYKFEKSSAGAKGMFEKERMAKERYWDKIDRMRKEDPNLSYDERRARYRKFSDEYLDEDKK